MPDALTPAGTAATIEADLKSTEPGLAQIAADASVGKVVLGDVKVAIQETRRGWRTTEFWGVIAASLLDVATQIPFHDKLIVGAIAAVYAIARGIAKNGVPHIS